MFGAFKERCIIYNTSFKERCIINTTFAPSTLGVKKYQLRIQQDTEPTSEINDEIPMLIVLKRSSFARPTLGEKKPQLRIKILLI